jgi:peroxiredoxin
MPLNSDAVPVGTPAPGFTLTAADGSEVSLEGLRGFPVVLVFLRGFR